MSDEIIVGVLLEDSWLTLEQVAAACAVEPQWLMQHVEDDLLPGVTSAAGTWHFSNHSLLRARRMRQLERDFEAGPELAALFADVLGEMDRMRETLYTKRR